MSIVSGFSDVSREELPIIPLKRKLECSIVILSRTTPISNMPYSMTSAELLEHKIQLNGLLDKVSYDLVCHLEELQYFL